MNVIDVYDIANSTWYKQNTAGDTPKYRVNPCAVVAAAAEYVLRQSMVVFTNTEKRFFLQCLHVRRTEPTTCRQPRAI